MSSSSFLFISALKLLLLLLITIASGCQPPPYHSSAAFGTPQYTPDPPTAFIQSPSDEAAIAENRIPTAPNADDSLKRPPNPFVPLDSQTAKECSTKTPAGFVEILDCTVVETFNNDGAVARYGSSECSFDSNSLCRFYTASDEEFQFRRGRFAHQTLPDSSFGPFEESLAILTRRPLGSVPNGEFIIVADPFGTAPEASAVLQSDIRCQIGNGQLSFDYWATIPDVVLRVCTRVGQERRCTSNIRYTPDSSRVQIDVVHPEAEQFVVEIIANEFRHPGVFILDNLEYVADLCEITTAESPTSDEHLISRPKTFGRPIFDADGTFGAIRDEPPPMETAPTLVDRETAPSGRLIDPQQPMDLCQKLECNFSRDLCQYSEPEVAHSVMKGKWQIARRGHSALRNATADNGRDGFAFVGMDDQMSKLKGRMVYILESPEFELDSDLDLFFDVYRRSNAISLQVCVDSTENCPYETPPVRSTTFWRTGEQISLPKGSHRLFFVATQWKRLKWLAVDNIRLSTALCSPN